MPVEEMKAASRSRKQPAQVAAAPPVRRHPAAHITAAHVDVFLAARLTAPAGDANEGMIALAKALPQAGISARLWRPYEDALSEARCLHLFGTAPEFLDLAKSAQDCGLKVVLTPQTWQEDGRNLGNARSWLGKAAAHVANAGQWLFSPAPAWQRDLYRAVDMLLPNSTIEAQRILRRFKLPAEKVRVVPHGVDPRWCEADPELFQLRADIRDFVLYAGSIEPRNEQLAFLYAMKNEDVPIVVLGDVAADCAWYLAECRRVAGPSVRFMSQLAADDPLLASAYAACRCLVVGKQVPAPERTALAAGISGTPLVLFEGGCGSEYFGHEAVYIRAEDAAGIRNGVRAALEQKRNKNLADHVRTYFSWSAVAGILRENYGRVWRPREMSHNPVGGQNSVGRPNSISEAGSAEE